MTYQPPSEHQPSRWPDACPNCTAEFAEGIGVIEVPGTLRVLGHAEHGMIGEGRPWKGEVSPHRVPDGDIYSHVAQPLTVLRFAIEWADVGECSECGEPVHRRLEVPA